MAATSALDNERVCEWRHKCAGAHTFSWRFHCVTTRWRDNLSHALFIQVATLRFKKMYRSRERDPWDPPSPPEPLDLDERIFHPLQRLSESTQFIGKFYVKVLDTKIISNPTSTDSRFEARLTGAENEAVIIGVYKGTQKTLKRVQDEFCIGSMWKLRSVIFEKLKSCEDREEKLVCINLELTKCEKADIREVEDDYKKWKSLVEWKEEWMEEAWLCRYCEVDRDVSPRA